MDSCISIDPRSIKLVAAFSIGIKLDEQDPFNGAFLAFGALNKELSKCLLDHEDILKKILFIGGTFTKTAEANNVPSDLLHQIPNVDVYVQTGVGRLNPRDRLSTLFVFICVSGTGKVHHIKVPLCTHTLRIRKKKL